MAIQIQNHQKKPRLKTTYLKKVLQIILDGLGYKNPEISLVMTDDANMQQLNQTWRGKNKSTDVLSFPQADEPLLHKPPQANMVLGDVVISTQTAAKQAFSQGHSLETEVQRLLVHGVLHLLGHDHVHGGKQARRMQQEEERLLKYLENI